eukprot:SAG31_NODE_22625_length_521_cov_1.362559_1_plen_76_part_10
MSDSESDSEEAEEPLLKYQRIGASVAEILQRDRASCLRTHEKFLAVGTQNGFVYILDLNGNEIKRWYAHASAVNDV